MAFSYLKGTVSNQMLDAYVWGKDRLDLNFKYKIEDLWKV